MQLKIEILWNSRYPGQVILKLIIAPRPSSRSTGISALMSRLLVWHTNVTVCHTRWCPNWAGDLLAQEWITTSKTVSLINQERSFSQLQDSADTTVDTVLKAQSNLNITVKDGIVLRWLKIQKHSSKETMCCLGSARRTKKEGRDKRCLLRGQSG